MILLTLTIITACIAVFIALAVTFSSPKRLSHIAFGVSLLATACAVFGDSMALFRPERYEFWKTVVFMSEAVMAPAWLLFVLTFTRTSFRETVSKFSLLILGVSPVLMIMVLVIPHSAFYYSPEFEYEHVLFLGNTGYIFNLLIVLYTVVSIVNLESTLRSSSGVRSTKPASVFRKR